MILSIVRFVASSAKSSCSAPKTVTVLLIAAALAIACPTSALAGSRVAAVAAAELHACALTSSGAVLCWGDNTFGELGNGTNTQSLTPVQVTGLTSGVIAIAAGGGDAPSQAHSCAITSSGGVVCWGNNADGQLGNNSATNSNVPVQVTGLTSGVTAIAAGKAHTCAIASGGALWCWGNGDYGQLGNNATSDSPVPVQVSGLASGVTNVTAGYSHTCAIVGGAAKCWGLGGNGQLGVGILTTSSVPLQVTGLTSGVTGISAGRRFTLAIVNGGAQCWGMNSSGQCGMGTTTPPNQLSPTQVTGLTSNVLAIGGGRYHGCAVMLGGAVYCWGYNGDGQLGDGGNVQHLAPALSSVQLGAANLAVGSRHTCIATAGGAAGCWGWDGNGQLGNNDLTSRNLPVIVWTLSGWPPRDVDGDAHSDILWRHATTGDVWVWPMLGTLRRAEWYLRTVPGSNWQIRAVGDFDGDGRADLMWRNSATGEIYYWRMGGYEVLSEVYVGKVSPAYDIVSAADYDGDTKADLLWRQTTNGEVWVWLMDGSNVREAYWVGTVDPAYDVAGSADMDGNGQADIVWRNKNNGEVWVWLIDEGFTQHYIDTVPDLGYKIAGVADYTGDGKADILWRHDTFDEVWMWPMNGATRVSQTYIDTVPDKGFRIVTSGDYDLDGKADIVWHHATLGEVWIWLMDGTTKLSETFISKVPDTGYQIVK
jgi:alpha-tubulin suppressor-like RCC1 family protein